MTKRKLMRKIPTVLFTSALLLLFFLWVGSFLKVQYTFEDLIPILQLESGEALAGENVLLDFQDALVESILSTDTMMIESDSAFPDSVVWITISLKNTVRIAGFAGAITYDTSILTPEYALDIWLPCPDTCPPETAWVATMEKTSRTDSVFLEGVSYWSAGVVNKHLDTTSFFTYVGFFQPALSPGSGPVAKIKFRVKPTATWGASTPLEWCISVGENTLPNNWSDSTGDITYVPQTLGGTFTVRGGGGPGNQCPAFASMPSQFEVNQGATLEFDVTAQDPDGDSLTLFMDPLDPSYDYSFPTKEGDSLVTQTFTFSPTFAQGPDTINVTFKAEDQHGCLTSKTVSIQIIETAQDLLFASSDEGGVPGSSDRMVPFVITNSISIYGFQFTLRWDHTMVDVDSFVPTDVIQDFSIRDNLGDSLGMVTVLVFGLAGQTIAAGIETVLYAAFSVHEYAPPGEVQLQLENAREAINPGEPSYPLGMVHGKFTIDLFGDANIDRTVDIADVVSVVGYILGDIDFTSRQFLAADVVPDDSVNVFDLGAIINIILGRWTGPSPSPYSDSEPPAIVRLDYEDLQPGATGEVKVMADLEVPVAGAQIEIRYDPEQLSFEAPRLSDWSDKFIMQYKDDKQGKLIVLLYNLSNDPISPGKGNFLSLPATVSSDAISKIKLEIDKILLADENAVKIPVDDGKTLVPKAFELSQNYPNPFNPTTTIRYTLPSVRDGEETLPTTLRIYNILGEVVRTLVDEPKSAGVHYEIWDGKDDQGEQVASGVYFYRLRAGEFSETKKMVLLK